MLIDLAPEQPLSSVLTAARLLAIRPLRRVLRLFWLASLLDILTTLLGFARGISEGNPAMVWLQVRYGTLAMFEGKLVLVLLLTEALAWLFLRRRRAFPLAAGIVIGVTALIVANNVWVILLSGGS